MSMIFWCIAYLDLIVLWLSRQWYQKTWQNRKQIDLFNHLVSHFTFFTLVLGRQLIAWQKILIFHRRKKFNFSTIDGPCSKFMLLFCKDIYDGYHYGKRIGKSCAYGELINSGKLKILLEKVKISIFCKRIINFFEFQFLLPHIYIALAMVDFNVQSFYLSNPLNSLSLYRVSSKYQFRYFKNIKSGTI
jgi:hypothetical protein